MAEAELIVGRSADGCTVTFAFPDGPQQAMAIAVAEEESERPVWLLTSDVFTAMLPYTVDSVEHDAAPSADELALERDLLARGVDPAALEAGRKSNRAVHHFEYGSVPPGFRQALPIGSVEALQPGKRYCVLVVGGIGVAVGTASFTA
jgi:hypothetical protein